ncbi:3-oxoacyl-[acyl-carrier protein] reductase [Paenibacillus shirakamiensis]|uniref:3-oxoacyl-[acyl-carrier protein] reductase n=1 Tax=Paenibacillus shirakamiensis TaxID=1265935 RepID=A0ABS4JK62_9BACL|nr:SDR family oxidoreductase [Paenibacillus shirakamiensis]MBP2001490.1 3-oxoacyl-[acyl-carrier protein] reductase [Paenibacillus shirakamiensis]
MSATLSGQVAIVTGASRGIGRAIAEELAANGAQVVVNYATSAAEAEEVIARIKQQGGEAISIQADLGQLSDVDKLFQGTLENYGRLDILVNNAGFMRTIPLANVTEEDFDKHFAVNVKGTFFAIQHAANHMQPGGRIINFSTSVVGQMFPSYSVYAGTKGAVEQFTRQLAKELGPKGITINAVAPGPVDTELFRQGKTEDQIAHLSGLNAFGRIGEPEDIAKVVLFLASEQSQWITGQTLRANGGFI